MDRRLLDTVNKQTSALRAMFFNCYARSKEVDAWETAPEDSKTALSDCVCRHLP
jgi:hypothetical protein